jgi:hypothetical protein
MHQRIRARRQAGLSPGPKMKVKTVLIIVFM